MRINTILPSSAQLAGRTALVQSAGLLLVHFENLLCKLRRIEIQSLGGEAKFYPPFLLEICDSFWLRSIIRDAARYLLCKRRDKRNESRSSCRNQIRVVYLHGSLSSLMAQKR